jgi:serine/threonine protein kinase
MILKERFDILRSLGKTHESSDYEALDLETGSTVHVRRFFCKEDYEELPEWADVFMTLGEQLTSIQHYNITQVLELGFDEDGPYMSTEPHELEPVIDLFPDGMDNESFGQMARQVLKGLDYLHTCNFKHGAALPNTVKVQQIEGKPHYQICDIGMHFAASLMNDTEYELDDFTFTAPEICAGKESTMRSDVYMFANLIYFYGLGGHPLGGEDKETCIDGHLNGEFPDLHEINEKLDPAWTEWLSTLIEKSPDKRCTTHQALSTMPKYGLDPVSSLIPATTEDSGIRSNVISLGWSPTLASPKKFSIARVLLVSVISAAFVFTAIAWATYLIVKKNETWDGSTTIERRQNPQDTDSDSGSNEIIDDESSKLEAE